MSILRGVGVFLLSSLFTFALLTLVTTQTIGDSLQKENLKAFAQSTMGPDIMEPECRAQCQNFEGITEDVLERCVDQCMESVELRINETGNVIDHLYEREIMGQSMDDAVSLMNQTFLFFALTVVSAAMILVVSESPLSTLGKDIISISSITLLISLLTPELVLMFSGASAENMISKYLGSGLEKMALISIALIAIGVALVVAEYAIRWSKKRMVLKKVKKK
ncbi:MAG: hypothetical protein V1818_00635 [Candidatus Aenigmatarchaeota archaeon]